MDAIQKEKLIQYLKQNLNLKKNYYNEHTTDWSSGYISCFKNIENLIINYKER